ncbi:CGNR zinc finger domain-containing protein [Amycolatopsis suaedae]|uniref:Zinc finger CGNR domain-containing protein n=1 Tax=Amycolatopsis suaedae TaxID=2510978 RepID=A0A4Q7J0B5_9PSEU|nr:CGNR zinc finger domain-containing protein [Amycolatopsis suaedae]RZQ59982.1 hypothetical protein EWH70_31650 [Amycolatopsis suaedae]
MDDNWHGYDLVGGHLALDLTNTVSWRRDPARYRDRLTLPGFLPAWLERTGLATELTDAALAPVLPALTALREATFDVITTGGTDTDGLAVLHRHLAAAHRVAAPATGLPLRWTLDVTGPGDVVPALALAVEDLLTSPDVELVGECAGPACAWLFVDRTRNRSRRWCSSADCGNRERARRHYRRTHGRVVGHPGGHPGE